MPLFLMNCMLKAVCGARWAISPLGCRYYINYYGVLALGFAAVAPAVVGLLNIFGSVLLSLEASMPAAPLILSSLATLNMIGCLIGLPTWSSD